MPSLKPRVPSPRTRPPASPPARPPASQRVRAVSAACEPLEHRLLYAAKLFSGPTGGSWNTAGNWSPTGVPNAADDVTLPAGINVVLNQTGNQANNITGAATSLLTITSGGSLSVSGTAAFADLALAGGLTLRNASTLGGNSSTWTAGSINGATLTVLPAAQLTLSGGLLSLVNTANLTVQGKVVHTAGELRTNASVIDVAAGASYDLAGGASITTTGNAAGFSNAGLLRKPSGAAAATVAVPYNPVPGSVTRSDSLGLVLAGGGTYTGGSFVVTNAADTVDLTGGTSPSVEGTYTASGSGKVLLASGTLRIGPTGLLFTFFGDNFRWTGGNIDGQGGRQLTNLGVLTFDGPLLGLNNGAALSNVGTITHLSGELRTNNSRIFNAGTYLTSAGVSITTSGNAAGFNNNATLRHTGGAATIAVPYNPVFPAAATADAGTLTLAGGGTYSGGNFNPAAGAVIDLTGGASPTVDGTLAGAGLGTVSLSSGTLRAAPGGITLAFPGSLFSWSGGAIDGSSNADVTNTGTVNLTGSLVGLNNGARLINSGLINHASGELRTNNSVINNTGTYDLTGSAAITTSGNAAGFNNAGLLRKPSGTAAATVAVPYNTVPGAVTRSDSLTLVLAAGGNSTGGAYVVTNAADTVDLTGNSAPTLAGTYTATGSGKVLLAAGQLNLGPTGLALNFPQNTFLWTGGAIDGQAGRTLTNLAFLTLDGPLVGMNNGVTFANAGTFIHASGELRTNNSVVSNTGTYLTSPGTAVTTSGNAAAFNNTGTLRHTAGSAFIAVPYNSTPSATAAVDAGTLTFSGGGSSTGGTYIPAAGALIDLTGTSTHTLAGTYTGSGAGTVSLASGTLRAAPGGFTLAFPAALFAWSGGLIDGNGGNDITNTGTVNLTGALVGLNNVARIVNNGLLRHLSGELRTNNSTLTNTPAGTYDLSDGASLTTSGNAAALTNSGLIRKPAGPGIATIAVPFTSRPEGTARAVAGTLTFAGAGTSTGGTFLADATAAIDLTGGASPLFAGTFTGAGPGQVRLASGTLRLDPAGVTFNFPAGVFHWSGGAIDGQGGATLTNAPTGTITLDGTLVGFNNVATLANFGTVSHLTGELRTNNAFITNAPSGTYDLVGGAAITTSGNAAGFTNSGLLRKPSGAGTASVLVPFNARPEGTVSALAGTLTLGNGGASTGGTYLAAAGATVDLTGGSSPTFVGTYTGSGAGRVGFSSGSFLVGPGGATLDFPGPLFAWTGGTLNTTTTGQGLTVAPTGVLNIAGPITSLVNTTTLLNLGLINHTSGELRTNNSLITNAAGGTYAFTNSAPASITTSGNAAGFFNLGTLSKPSGAGTVDLTVPFNSDAAGVVSVATSLLTLRGGGTSAGGTFNVAQGGTVDLTGGSSHTLAGSYSGSGAGLVLFQSGTLFPAPAGFTLNFPADLLVWTGGSINGQGGRSATNTGFLTLRGGVATLDNLATLINRGQLLHVSGELRTNNSFVLNDGNALYDLQSGAVTTSGNAAGFTNLGTLQKAVSAGASSIDVPYDSPGTTRVTAGTLTLSRSIAQLTTPTLTAGTWLLGPAAALSTPNAPAITASAAAVFLADATSVWSNLLPSLAANSGTLTFGGVTTVGGTAGTFAQSGALAPLLSSRPSAALFGQLTAAAFSLAGSLAPRLAPGFVPTPEDRYVLLSNTGAAPLAGTFDGLPEGAVLSLSDGTTSYPFFVTYAGGDGNDLALTAGRLAFSLAAADTSVTSHGPGDAATLALTLTNTGNVPLPAAAATLFLSVTPAFDPATAVPVGTAPFPTGPVGGTAAATAVVTPPASLPVGMYYVVAVANGITAVTAAAVFAVSRKATSLTVGQLVPTFGTGGIATTTVAGPTFSTVDSVTQPDGKLLVAASSSAGGFVLLRFNPDGSLDAGFGTAGVVRTPLLAGDAAAAVALQPDGKILLAGTAASDFALSRYDPDGSPDAAFGTAGTVTADLGTLLSAAPSADLVTSLAQGPGGVIYLAGSSDAGPSIGGGDFAALRFSPAGVLDPSFGTSGVALVDFAAGFDQANTLSVQKDGKPVLAGFATAPDGVVRIAAARLLASGAIDTKFAAKGRFLSTGGDPDNRIFASAIQPDGKILLAGFYSIGPVGAPTQSNFYLTRLTTAGKPDTRFGGPKLSPNAPGTPAGQVRTPLPGVVFSAINDLTLTPAGKILVAGKTASSPADTATNRLGVAVAQYLPTGALDPAFNAGAGFLLLFQPTAITPAAAPPPTPFDTFASAAVGLIDITPGGAVLAAASRQVDANTTAVTLASLVPDGVDLVPSAFTLTAVPPSVVGGAKGKATLTVSNTGTLPLNARVPVSLALSPDAGPGANDTPFFSTSLPVSLKPGTSRKLSLSFAFPTTSPDGAYFVVATLDPAATLAEINPTNNDRLTASATTVAAPFVDLAVAFVDPTLATATVGKKSFVTLLLTNSGNVPAAGPAALLLSLQGTTEGDLPPTLATAAPKLKLAPGKTLKLKLPFTPTSPFGPAPLSAALTYQGTPAETLTANNTAFSTTPITIT